MIVILWAMGFHAMAQTCGGPDSLLVERIKKNIPGITIPDWGTVNAVKLDSLNKKDSALLKDFQTLINKNGAEDRGKSLSFERGFINYNMSYRETIDTPFMETDIFQHLVTANAQFVIGGALPLELTYYERNSNSDIFRDYRDFRVDVNPAMFRQLQAKKIKEKIVKNISRVKFPAEKIWKEYQAVLQSQNYTSGFMNRPDIISLLVQCKERLINANEYAPDCKWSDSALAYTKLFIEKFSGFEQANLRFGSELDSLEGLLTKQRRIIAETKALIAKPGLQVSDIERLNVLAKDMGALPVAEIPGMRIARHLRSFSAGRVLPSQSPLTVNGVNLRGINSAFEGNNWYVAIAAGAIDTRLFDFNKRSGRVPRQYVYSIKGGWGRRDATHLHITGYKGVRSLHPGAREQATISGISTELQYVLAPGHKLLLEVAQSTSSSSVSGANMGSQKFSLKNNNARAYFVQWQSSFLKLNARVEAMFQKMGIDYQAFNSYRVNAATEMFSVRYDQHLFRKTLGITVALRKNDFSNPFVVQDFSSNTVFKTFQLNFRKRNWPVLSAGYIPSTQYSKMGDIVYETRYQVLNANVFHSYQVGTARMTTTMLMSKFFDRQQDSLYLYNNALNLSFFQYFTFNLHTANLGINYTGSGHFKLGIAQAGVGTTAFKGVQVEAGLKIFRNQKSVAKTGFYGQGSVSLSQFGMLRCWYDDGYLPSPSGDLINNRQWNISYLKFFKKR